jgi:prophage regulatory protein
MHDEPPRPAAPSSILRIKTVMQRTGLTRPTLYRKIAEGTFPKQIRISTHCIGWRESAVDAWLRSPMDYRASDSSEE